MFYLPWNAYKVNRKALKLSTNNGWLKSFRPIGWLLKLSWVGRVLTFNRGHESLALVSH